MLLRSLERLEKFIYKLENDKRGSKRWLLQIEGHIN
jgi:hypothetical protein